MNLHKPLIYIQATYMLITAIWPIIHIESFMTITGPKHDIWLVKTVGALLIPVALALYASLVMKEKTSSVILGIGTAIAFITIDFYYAVNDVIWDVYLLDGALQIVFFVSWLILIFRYNILNGMAKR